MFNDTYKKVNKNERISYWDVQWQAVRYLYDQLSIIPCVNMITNLGLGEESTHAKTARIPKKQYDQKGKIKFAYNKKYEINFPICHPKYIIRNVDHDEKVDKKLYQNIVIKICKRLCIIH